jgi:hypothetical protein
MITNNHFSLLLSLAPPSNYASPPLAVNDIIVVRRPWFCLAGGVVASGVRVACIVQRVGMQIPGSVGPGADPGRWIGPVAAGTN